MNSPAPIQAPRRGFALLLVLFTLALAVGILAIVARRATDHTRAAMRAERALQARWALAAGDPLLARAGTLLVEEKDGRERHLAARSFQLQMGNRQVVVLLADEQAKPNLNTLAGRLPEQDLDSLLAPYGNRAQALPSLQRPFWCYEQVVGGGRVGAPSPPPSRILGGDWPDPERPSLANRFTLWGDGRLHVQAASREAWIRTLGPEVPQSEAEAFVDQLPKSWPTKTDIPSQLEPLTARWTAAQKQVLQRRTCDASHAWSVWVAVGEEASAGHQVGPSRAATWRLTVRRKETDGDVWRRVGW